MSANSIDTRRRRNFSPPRAARFRLIGMNDPVLLCYCSCPDAGSAQAIAEALVDERLAACAQSLPGMRSTYRWRGAVTTDAEVLLLIKTTAGALDALTGRVLELHPYEVPEVIAVPVERGHAAYLDWVRANVQTQGRRPRPGAKRGP
jgi:periplasmic divalent cation tolerance protein